MVESIRRDDSVNVEELYRGEVVSMRVGGIGWNGLRCGVIALVLGLRCGVMLLLLLRCEVMLLLALLSPSSPDPAWNVNW